MSWLQEESRGALLKAQMDLEVWGSKTWPLGVHHLLKVEVRLEGMKVGGDG